MEDRIDIFIDLEDVLLGFSCILLLAAADCLNFDHFSNESLSENNF
jgi:hypothetical protein